MKFLATLCIIFSEMVHAGPSREELKERIEKIVNNSGIKKAHLGLMVADRNKVPIYALNDSKKFVPASILKLLTSQAVIHYLLPNYQVRTQVFIDGEKVGTTLKGNIYLKGNGDPTFVSEKMWMLVNDFTRTGIKKITGQIITDDTYFDEERNDPFREMERNARAYDAPVGALSFNWNSTTIYIRPAEKVGDKAKVWIDPENEAVILESDATTSAKGTNLDVIKKTVGDKDRFIVTGKIAVSSKEVHFFKSITNPAYYAGANFREFLKQRQIDVPGAIVKGGVPANARLVAEQDSNPLSFALNAMNKFSNNFIAEMLTKSLAAAKVGPPAHMKDGIDQIRTFLEKELGFDPKTFDLVNASGLSRKNQFMPKHFIEALAWVKNQFRIYPEFLQSLPISGVDGTLERRLRETPAENWVRAKTGLLNGNVALAGYAGRVNEEEVLFVFIYNGPGDEARVRGIFDNMAVALAK